MDDTVWRKKNQWRNYKIEENCVETAVVFSLLFIIIFLFSAENLVHKNWCKSLKALPRVIIIDNVTGLIILRIDVIVKIN